MYKKEESDNLIDATLVDGVLTEKEKEILFPKKKEWFIQIAIERRKNRGGNEKENEDSIVYPF